MRFSALPLVALAKWGLTLFLVASCYLLVTISPTFAQTAPATTSAGQIISYPAPNTNPDVPHNLHTWTQNVMIETMSAVACQISGIDPTNPNGKCLGIDQKTGKIGYVEGGGGAIGLMTNAITMLYTPPINSGEYFQNLASDFGIVKNVHAQTNKDCSSDERGTGFCGLSPILGLWTAMRNIAYLLFVIVFVVIGLAIMLRVKIDPRTVMTIQNQIPKMIVGLLLVTFSYAIAGFLIDLMYTSIYLAGNVIVSTDPKITNEKLVTKITQTSNPFGAANEIRGATGGVGGLAFIAAEPAGSIGGFIIPIFDNLQGRTVLGALGAAGGATAGLVVPFFGPLLGGIVGGALAAGIGPHAIGILTTAIAFLVIAIAILIALFRLWFSLIKAYLFLIINVVFAPFWILIGLFPGSHLSFGNWLREIISDLAVFPAVVVMFLMGRVLMDQFAKGGDAFTPPMIGSFANPEKFSSLIGMGIILLTPAMLDKVKDALKAPKVDLSAVYGALGAGSGVVTNTTRSTAGSIATIMGPSTSEKMNATGRKALIHKMFDKL